MNHLELSYRRVLRTLPAPYRLRWEEEMVEAFLASTETDDPERAEFLADFGRPRWSEVASVLLLSARLRLGLAGTPTPRSSIWGGAFRIVALSWLLAGAAMMTVVAAELMWPGDLFGASVAPVEWTDRAAAAWHLVLLFWIAAYAALLLGRLRLARAIAALLVLRSVIELIISVGESLFAAVPAHWSYSLPHVVLEVCLLATLWTFAPEATPRRRGPWIVAYAGGVAVMSAVVAAQIGGLVPWEIIDQVGLYTAVLVPAALIHLARRRRDPAWSLALALMVSATLALRLATLPLAMASAPAVGVAPQVAAAVEVVVLVLVAVPLVGLSARSLARLGGSGLHGRPELG